MTSEGTILLDKAFEMHVLERGLLSDGKGNLRKLGCKKKARRVTESVLGSANIDVTEERKSLDIPVLIHWVVWGVW